MKFSIQMLTKFIELFPAVFPMYGIHAETKHCLCSKKEGCEHSGKHPMGSVKKNETFKSLAEVELFLKNNIGSNFALLLDTFLDLVVVDVDKRNGGLESFDKLQKDFGTLPNTVTTLTGGDGLHLYFKVNDKNCFQSKLDNYPGIDIKYNGLIMLPGSNHQSGKKYVWKENYSPNEI